MTQQNKKAKRAATRQARAEAQRTRERARKRKRMLTIGLIAAFVIAVAFFGSKRALQTKKLVGLSTKNAGCVLKHPKELPASPHMNPEDPAPEYSSNPPSSGLHLPSTAPGGAVDETVDERLLVHNLEHGYVIVHYKGISESEINKIHDMVDSYADGVIAQPNTKITSPIAMVSWGTLQTCKDVSIPVIKSFIKEHCNKGPEKIGLPCGS